MKTYQDLVLINGIHSTRRKTKNGIRTVTGESSTKVCTQVMPLQKISVLENGVSITTPSNALRVDAISKWFITAALVMPRKLLISWLHMHLKTTLSCLCLKLSIAGELMVVLTELKNRWKRTISANSMLSTSSQRVLSKLLALQSIPISIIKRDKAWRE